MDSSENLEQSLLGAMLQSADGIADLRGSVAARDFAAAVHREIFNAIVDRFAGHGDAGVSAVAEQLAKGGLLPDVGGEEYLQKLLRAGVTGRRLEACVRQVRGGALLRRLELEGTRIAQTAAEADPVRAEDVLNDAMRGLEQAGATQPADEYMALADAMEGALDEIEHIANRSGQMTGLPTGFTDLDSLTQGLHPGQLIVVAGRPAIGKSTLALDFVRSAAIKNGLSAALFTLEMKRNEAVMRLLSAEARVALHHMRSGTMTDDDWARLAKRMGEVSAAPLFISDTDNLTYTQIRAQCRRMRERHDLRLVVVDFINMLTYGTRPFDNRYLEISEICRCLKQLAKELDVPIVAVSQLNRGPEARTDKKPMLMDLRDAGTLEDNADLVILVHREDAYERESPRAGEADLIVAKHRQGPTATITVAYQGHYSRFVDMQQS